MSSPFGPLSPEQFQEAVNAPAGGAAAILRKHDPLWGKLPAEDGVPIKWKVRLRQEVTMCAYLTIEAVTEEQALALAETEATAKGGDLSWDCGGEGDIFAEDAVPA